MQKFLRISALSLLLLGVSNCATVGPVADCSGKAIRLTEQVIDKLSDAEVEDVLNHNEFGAKRKCYVPNK
jgi:hypothetical protein